MIIIQVSVAGHEGSPVTLYSGYDEDVGGLYVNQEEPLTAKRKKQSIVISNQSNIDYDILFKEEDLKE